MSFDKHNHDHNQNTEQFHHHPKFLHASEAQPSPSMTRQQLICFLPLSLSAGLARCRVNKIIEYADFVVSVLLLSTMHPRLSHTLVCIRSLFLFITEYCSVVWLSHSLFTPSPIEGHVSCTQSLAIINNKESCDTCLGQFQFPFFCVII